MASKSGELLADDDTEGILAVIDNVYLLSRMIFRPSSQLQFPKYGIIIQRAVFYAKIAEKHIKQKED